MNGLPYLLNQHRQRNPSIAAIDAPTFRESREDEHRPSGVVQESQLDVIGRDLRGGSVPVAAVVFDTKLQLWECEVEIVFVDRVNGDRLKANSVQRFADFEFIRAQLRTLLLRSRSLAQVLVRSPRAANHGGRLRDHRGSFIGGEEFGPRLAIGVVTRLGAVARLCTPSGPGPRELRSAIAAGAYRQTSLREVSTFPRAIANGRLVWLLHAAKWLAAVRAIEMNVRHSAGPSLRSSISPLNGSATLIPILATPLGQE